MKITDAHMEGIKSHFVRFYEGEDSVGNPIIEIRCICEYCKRFVAPIHFYKEFLKEEK